MTAPLGSWADGAARRSILDFVARVTDASAASFVPPAERIATFDNDGTLWCEQPVPVQVVTALDVLVGIATADPAKRAQQPFKAAYEKDMAWFGQYMANDRIPALIGMLLEAGAGETQPDAERRIAAWFARARHPQFGVPYQQVVYTPMVELLAFLRQSGFKVFICSGGGMDFVRMVSEEIYGVPRECVIGSNMKLTWEERDSGPVLVRQAGIVEPFNDGPGKPINIQLHAGNPPILAGGNSDGDLAMLQFAAASGRPFLNLLVRHDDAEREYAYTTSAEKAIAASDEHGWASVSMKDDWTRVFPFA